MPIVVHAKTRRISQSEFGKITYATMGHVFDIHNQMGRFFDESIYKQAVAARTGNGRAEVCIEVTFEDFRKEYFMDLLVDDAAVFELKVAKKLSGRHRAQLLNYLLLTDLSHGKLINLGGETVEHEFVNTSLTRNDRIGFIVDDSGFSAASPNDRRLFEYLSAILRDWGTGLEISLYTMAAPHFLGGEAVVTRNVDTFLDSTRIGRQKMQIVSPDTAFVITQIAPEDDLSRFEDHCRRLLNHTALRRMQWINVTLHQVTFRTITRP